MTTMKLSLFSVEVRNLLESRVVVMAAESADDAVMRVLMVVRGWERYGQAVPFVPVVGMVLDGAIAATERIESDWCDHCDGNDCVSDSMFDLGYQFINDTYDALYWADA